MALKIDLTQTEPWKVVASGFAIGTGLMILGVLAGSLISRHEPARGCSPVMAFPPGTVITIPPAKP